MLPDKLDGTLLDGGHSLLDDLLLDGRLLDLLLDDLLDDLLLDGWLLASLLDGLLDDLLLDGLLLDLLLDDSLDDSLLDGSLLESLEDESLDELLSSHDGSNASGSQSSPGSSLTILFLSMDSHFVLYAVTVSDEPEASVNRQCWPTVLVGPYRLTVPLPSVRHRLRRRAAEMPDHPTLATTLRLSE